MIARTLSKLYPAPIALCENDLVGTIEQTTNDPDLPYDRGYIGNPYGSGHHPDSLKPPPAARGLHSRLILMLPEGFGVHSHLSRSYSNGSLH
jgi:hypothetical protein